MSDFTVFHVILFLIMINMAQKYTKYISQVMRINNMNYVWINYYSNCVNASLSVGQCTHHNDCWRWQLTGWRSSAVRATEVTAGSSYRAVWKPAKKREEKMPKQHRWPQPSIQFEAFRGLSRKVSPRTWQSFTGSGLRLVWGHQEPLHTDAFWDVAATPEPSLLD